MQEALIVHRETHISAPPAAVFALLTDPEKILRWYRHHLAEGAAGEASPATAR
jgi:uncharacterized protein YndB with AHSA1/START domain